jgi:hypothetical protein
MAHGTIDRISYRTPAMLSPRERAEAFALIAQGKVWNVRCLITRYGIGEGHAAEVFNGASQACAVKVRTLM